MIGLILLMVIFTLFSFLAGIDAFASETEGKHEDSMKAASSSATWFIAAVFVLAVIAGTLLAGIAL